MRKSKTSESYFRVKLEEREFWQDLQLSGVLDFQKLEAGYNLILALAVDIYKSHLFYKL